MRMLILLVAAMSLANDMALDQSPPPVLAVIHPPKPIGVVTCSKDVKGLTTCSESFDGCNSCTLNDRGDPIACTAMACLPPSSNWKPPCEPEVGKTCTAPDSGPFH